MSAQNAVQEHVAAHLQTLVDAGVPSAEHDLRLLVRTALERNLDDQAIAAWVGRRAAREPLQLITGSTWFRNVEIICEPGVFIPRPETEIVAGLAIAAAGSCWPKPLIVETCAGTGAITCALVTEVPDSETIAVEVEPTAARLATRNVAAAVAGRAGTPAAGGARAVVRGGSLLTPVPSGWHGRVDVIVANPPYLPATDSGSWEPEVAKNDPPISLVGGSHGNEIVEELFDLATTWLRPGGFVVLEVDPRLAADAAAYAERVGLDRVAIKPDLTGRDRAIVARRPG